MDNTITIFNWRHHLDHPDIDAIGEDVVLFNDLKFLPTLSFPFKSDIFIEMICISGHMKLSINLTEYTIQAPVIFSMMPDKIIQVTDVSDDFSARFILLSSAFLSSLLTGPSERLPMYLAVNSNPMLPLNKEDLEGALEYYHLYQKEIRKKKNPYRLEAIKHLLQAGFYGSSYHYREHPVQMDKTKHEILTEEFLNLVNRHYREEREVGFYADKLHLTPKYLSKVIKEKSSKSANNWVDEHVVLEAKALLKSTNMTVQQISDHLHFPSQSFFGKYFKRRTGVSPKEFRKL